MNFKLEFKIVGLVVIVLVLSALLLGFFSVNFIRGDIEKIVNMYSNTSVDFIKYSIEETMITGNADITRDLIEKRGGAEGVESITVLDAEGKEAFFKEERSDPEDIEIINKIKDSKSTFSQKNKGSIVYYMPLINTSRCIECHDKQGSVLGAVKVSMSVKEANLIVSYRTKVVLISLLFGIILFGAILWVVFKKTVITPIKDLKDATAALSHGDLSFRTSIRSNDEMGTLSNDIKKAIRGIGNIIQRQGAVSKRVANVTVGVEKESGKVLEGTQLESEAISNILSAIEELNGSIGAIAESIGGVSASAEETAASVDEMVANTEQITKNTIELSGAIDSTSSSIEQMSASIKEVAQRTEELTVSAEETLSATEEINSAVKEIESNTKESARLSEKVTSDASSFGMVAMDKASEGMDRIRQSVEKTAEFIEKLGGRSEEIGKILNVIAEITDQTTLLALNAAILAAQAGEHGKGFSVVADEIKDLAERTSFSTQEIDDLIQAVRAEVKGAVNAMAEGLKTVEEGSKLSVGAKEALKKIIESSQQSTKMASDMEHATSEQTKGIRFVADAMENVKDMIGQIAKATSEQSKGVSLIISATDKIREITKHLKNATIEQSKGGKQIYKAVEEVSMRIHEISKGVNEQKSGSNNIFSSLEKIKYLPEENRKRAFSMNRSLRGLLKDAELLMTELNRFKVAVDEETSDILKMGVMPLESPAEMFKRFSLLENYLTSRLNKRVELKVAVDFEETVRNIGDGTTDICYMTPSTYIEAKDKYGVEVIAMALRKGKPYQHTVIVAKEGGKINSMEDIKGHSFAFGDKRSTSSYIVPRAMLQETGIDLKDLSFYDHLGHHDDVAKAVINGEFDAGGIMESTAEKFKGQGIKFLKYSPEIPEFNICVSKKMSEEEKNRIKQAFLELKDDDNEGRDVLQSISHEYTGFTESQDSDYDVIRGIMQKLGLL
jgi:methyl-accepting chemotaxis protein